jgi:hypothetical protein
MLRGHSSIKNNAVAIATGTPISNAMAEVTSVPMTSGSPRKISLEGFQSLPNTNPSPKWLIAVVDWPISRMKK